MYKKDIENNEGRDIKDFDYPKIEWGTSQDIKDSDEIAKAAKESEKRKSKWE